jgi:glycosyltransferase involved in cell wall biosynthesis
VHPILLFIMSNPQYPKISIIIVNYNLGNFLEQCIQSVVNQGYPNLEVIVIDGGSTDNSIEILKKYQKYFTYWVSEQDEGQYDAVNKGFKKSTGNILAWINSDDKYLPKSFFVVADIFSKYSDVQWLTGLPKEYTEEGSILGRITLPWARWSKFRFYTNDFQFIQQESCFWSRSLWERSGSGLDTNFKLAGDMELWSRFFRHEKLHSTVFELAGFRYRKSGQRSKECRVEYLKECNEVIKREQKRMPLKFKFLRPLMYFNRWFFGPFFFFDIVILNKLYPFFFRFPKIINYDFEEHQYVRKNIMIKHPPIALGKLQIHRKVFKIRK